MSVLSKSLNIFMSFLTCCLNQLTFPGFWFGLTWELHRTLKKKNPYKLSILLKTVVFSLLKGVNVNCVNS